MTNPADNIEQMQEKMLSLFAAGERQGNFRASFTPSKNYAFSRRSLNTLFSRVASIIANIVTSISHGTEAPCPLPRIRGQRKDLVLWKVPALFGDGPMKSDFMPLGFQFSPHPDQGKRCDLPDCSIVEDTPWKIFEGCWHSFHFMFECG